MKSLSFGLVAATLSMNALAQATSPVLLEDWAHVVSSTPRYEQISAPTQICHRERIVTQAPRDNTGAIVGGISGALIGSQVGRGNGRVAGAAVGAAAGAIIGDRIDNSHPTYVEREVDRCVPGSQVRSEFRGYDVLYEYQGRTYSTFMPYAPGDRLRLQITIRPQ